MPCRDRSLVDAMDIGIPYAACNALVTEATHGSEVSLKYSCITMHIVSPGTVNPLSTRDVVHLLQSINFTAAQKELTLGDSEASIGLFIYTAAIPSKRPIAAACRRPETVTRGQTGELFLFVP